MIPSLSSTVLLVSFPSVRNLAFFNPCTHFPPISHTRLFSSSTDVAKDVDSFTVSYFINSCGLSLESSKLVSKRVQIKDPSNADSVLDCLKIYGFSDADIKKVVRGHPQVITLNAEKILKPKMEFFLSIGAKTDDLVAIICRNPNLLGSSLNKKIIPCYDFFKRVFVHDELVVKSLKRSSWIWIRNLEENAVPNMELLKKVGVPESSIQYYLVQASCFLGLDNAKFSERVNRVIEMGFDPLKLSFIDAVRCWPTESSWECKAQLCRTWGWSESDMMIAFKKNPVFIQTSVEKLTAVMDFLVNKMGWDRSVVAAASCYVFNHNLEKSIIPKCSVIRVLQFKGMIREDFPLSSFLPFGKKSFLERYVFRYLEQVPELLDIYEGNLDLSELGYGFEEKLDTKL